jgi:hypothetical protein
MFNSFSPISIIASVISTGSSRSGSQFTSLIGLSPLHLVWLGGNRTSMVHFYQFKNPAEIDKEVPAGEVDKLISGFRLILLRKHDQIANPELKSRLDEVYQQLPKGYRIHHAYPVDTQAYHW